MRLSQVTLTHFRCFEHLQFVLAPDLTVLVGNNGAGKTAILDGIAYALSRILTRLPGIQGKNLRREDIRLGPDGVHAPYVRIEARTTDGVPWTRTLKRDPTRQTADKVPEDVGDKALFEFLDPTIHAAAEGREVTLPVFAYYGVSRAVLEIPERRRGFRKEFQRFEALEHALEPTTRFKDIFEWFYAQERDEMERLTADPDFIPGLIRKIEDRNAELRESDGRAGATPLATELASLARPSLILRAVREAVSLVVPGFSGPRIKSHPLRMVLTQRLPDSSERELSLQMLSDGYRTMLALVMDFARRLAQANPHLNAPLQAEAILMVDEIDLHLHPVWQQTVIPSFRRAFPNTQLILSTHSPQVLTTVEAEKIAIVAPEGVRSCPVPTYGARSCDVVSEVLGLESLRPPDNQIAEKISRLFQALDDGRLDESRRLRGELESWAKGFPEPDLVRADLLLRQLEHQHQRSLPAA